MKKILIFLTVSVVLGFSSCKDFLTIVPSDARFLQDVQSLKQTLAAYLYNYNQMAGYNSDSEAPRTWHREMWSEKFNAYSDVWTFSNWSGTLSEVQQRYVIRGVIDGNEWSQHYAIIGFMNLILNEIDHVPGDDVARNFVKGEALMHRAYSLLKLLQYYSPMDDASMGVPMHLGTYDGINEADLSRKPQSVVFDRILADLSEVERLLGITPPRSTYNIAYNADFLYRIMAQAYWWKASGPAAADGDWAAAARAAELAVEAAGTLPWDMTQLETIFKGFSLPPSGRTVAYPECLDYYNSSSSPVDYRYNSDIFNQIYASNDLRRNGWFTVIGNNISTNKISFMSGMMAPQFTFRLAETYLIMIEAYAHTDFDKGMEALRKWQGLRYSGAESGWPTPLSAEELSSEVRLERKREFFQENDIHWLDMKRFGVTDEGRRAGNIQALPLTQFDIRYQFMIPDIETSFNDLEVNPGWEDYRDIRQFEIQ